MQLFYNPLLDRDKKQFNFDKIESKHIVRVLRKKEGDILYITNGKGFLFTAEVRIANDKNCLVAITHVEEKPKPWSYNLHIAIAPTKNNDRFEWFLEKATEIGIDEITPIICDHSERKVLKSERMQKIIESASKQSLKYHFPKLNEVTTFKTFVSQHNSDQLYIAHCEELDKKSLQSELKEVENITILIGPEGDFSLEEIKIAIGKNYTPISLGESRLRTETAGIIAAHTVSLLHKKT
jgi:16S rRNA (uracil1498-N3)-methyltransferase